MTTPPPSTRGSFLNTEALSAADPLHDPLHDPLGEMTMFDTTRRKMLGTTFVGAGSALCGRGLAALAANPKTKGKVLLDVRAGLPRGLAEAATSLDRGDPRPSFTPVRQGRTIPNGPLAFSSRFAPEALDPQEQMLLLATVAGNTGWRRTFRSPPGLRGQASTLHHRRRWTKLSFIRRIQHNRVLLYRR